MTPQPSAPFFGLDTCKGKEVGCGTGTATQLHEFIDKSMILNFTEQVYLIFTVCRHCDMT